jgi:GNAT superfamily N-acetyltransferase
MTAHLDIRSISAADLHALAVVDPRLTSDARHQAHIADLLGSGMSWAAFAGEEARGFAVVTRHFFGFPFVDLLEVAEDRRRDGIGTALIDRCETAHSADRIFTSTNESNTPMRRLLAKAEWEVTGLIENLDPGDPELVFVKLRA